MKHVLFSRHLCSWRCGVGCYFYAHFAKRILCASMQSMIVLFSQCHVDALAWIRAVRYYIPYGTGMALLPMISRWCRLRFRV